MGSHRSTNLRIGIRHGELLHVWRRNELTVHLCASCRRVSFTTRGGDLGAEKFSAALLPAVFRHSI
jgi:hypothetical protein